MVPYSPTIAKDMYISNLVHYNIMSLHKLIITLNVLISFNLKLQNSIILVFSVYFKKTGVFFLHILFKFYLINFLFNLDL